jgi:hypothetical protein
MDHLEKGFGFTVYDRGSGLQPRLSRQGAAPTNQLHGWPQLMFAAGSSLLYFIFRRTQDLLLTLIVKH